MNFKYSMRLTALGLSFIFVFFAVAHLTDMRTDTAVFSYDVKKTAPTVVIDPGHGGADGGAVSDSGILEKDVNLQIAQRIAALYKTMGVSCILTRNEDIMLNGDETEHKKLHDLKSRVQIARNTENCIFLSIHQNKFPQKQYKGLQVYYSKHDPASQIIAEKIQSAVRNELQPYNTRQIKQATSAIYVLDNLQCPAVLVECGFLSNDEETSYLISDEYQKALSTLIAVNALG